MVTEWFMAQWIVNHQRVGRLPLVVPRFIAVAAFPVRLELWLWTHDVVAACSCSNDAICTSKSVCHCFLATLTVYSRAAWDAFVMGDDGPKYPGETASPEQVFALADEYRRAAHLLVQQGKKGKPLTRAPMRLSAIHAIELYLTALLLKRGRTASQIRGLQHDLGVRAQLAATEGLKLRKRTAEHLHHLSLSREYLVTRYGPELASTTSNPTRLSATLEEVAQKIAVLLQDDTKSPPVAGTTVLLKLNEGSRAAH